MSDFYRGLEKPYFYTLNRKLIGNFFAPILLQVLSTLLLWQGNNPLDPISSSAEQIACPQVEHIHTADRFFALVAVSSFFTICSMVGLIVPASFDCVSDQGIE
ncbi:hypothetical protein [Malonomonas rubra]|uniref:hypothetical protein n=1 Tax=Malonomonas rubra TaxID=57040 RepID=UPI0026EE7DBA|nr:hypothetical protein [Malonomonas rubra]